ncbi:MAG TPA: hypothetical protein VFP84_34035 [Kofleriaceae bacterium]|nr:hypothetical protein [Kofleriaceae bacterium]
MTRVVILLALISISGACGGAAQQTPAGEPMIAKKVGVSWGIEKHDETGEAMADVFLATTDETGKQVSHPLGRYKGACEVITPAADMNAPTGVACRTGGTGTELHAVIQHGDEIVVLKLGLNEGAKPDPMAREVVTSVKVPLGAKIEVTP